MILATTLSKVQDFEYFLYKILYLVLEEIENPTSKPEEKPAEKESIPVEDPQEELIEDDIDDDVDDPDDEVIEIESNQVKTESSAPSSSRGQPLSTQNQPRPQTRQGILTCYLYFSLNLYFLVIEVDENDVPNEWRRVLYLDRQNMERLCDYDLSDGYTRGIPTSSKQI